MEKFSLNICSTECLNGYLVDNKSANSINNSLVKKNEKHLVIGNSGTSEYVINNIVPHILENHKIDNIYVFAADDDDKYLYLVDTVYDNSSIDYLNYISERHTNLIIFDQVICGDKISNFVHKYPILTNKNTISIYITQQPTVSKCEFDSITCNSYMADSDKQRLFTSYISKYIPTYNYKQFVLFLKLKPKVYFTFFSNSKIESLKANDIKNKIISKKLTKLNLLDNASYRGKIDKYLEKENHHLISNWDVNYDECKKYKFKNSEILTYFKNSGWKNIKIETPNYENIKCIKLVVSGHTIYNFNHRFHKFTKDWILPLNNINITSDKLYDDKYKVLPNVCDIMVIVEFKKMSDNDDNYWKMLSFNHNTTYITCELVYTSYYNKGCEILVSPFVTEDFGEHINNTYVMKNFFYHPVTYIAMKFVNDDNIKNVKLVLTVEQNIVINFIKCDNKLWTINLPFNSEQNETINFSKIDSVTIVIDGNNYVGFSLTYSNINIFRIMNNMASLAFVN